MVAGLSFGFWTTLFSKHLQNTTIWRNAVSRAFPGHLLLTGRYVKRSDVAALYTRIRRFRNRIAHHEPVFGFRLQDRYDDLLLASQWIGPPSLRIWAGEQGADCQGVITTGPPP